MPLISLDDEDQRWVPTHVNVTVLRARGLRTKGKQGSRYVYTIIQVGKEKYTTGLVEKAEEPHWGEECAFELLPGLLEAGGTSAYPAGSSNLVLTVMHRVLIGLDVFLGQTIVPLDKVFQEGTCPRNEWLKLHSKAGRKEKERGELQVTIQFTRNNMTASMYDLTVKDKPRSAFGKLKDRVTGKKRDVESSSAILPGRYAALSGTVGPPFAGDGGPDDLGEDEGVDEQRSKMKDFFLKGKLRKNSDTRSCSSLASDSSMASSGGEPFVPIEIPRTPIYSSRVMEPFRMDTDGGIKVMTHKRAHSDEASKIAAVPRPSPAVENLKGQSMALSKSTLCINGSHVYSSEPVSPKSPNTIPAKRSLLEKCAPLSRSLQNLTRRGEDLQKSDGRRFSIEKSKKEDGDMDGAQTQGAASPEGKPAQAAEVVDKGKKLRKTLFSSGRSDSLPAKPEQSQVSAPLEGRRRGWFGSGDSQNKPRLGVSPKVESSSETPCPTPFFPNQPPCSLPLDRTTGSVSPPSGNPFTQSSPTPPSISPSNPFLTRLQQNPFFEDLIAEDALQSPPAGYCSLNSSLCHYPGNAAQNRLPTIKRERPRSMSRQMSLPVIMPETTNTNSNANPNHSLCERAGEWDDFEEFATSRLKSPNGTPTRPPSAPFLSQMPNTNQEACVNDRTSGLRVDEVDMGVSRPWDLPPLPPRRPMRTQVISTDSWLDRAQELAVQKEACFLSRTDFASLQHVRDGDLKRNSQNVCSDKELQHGCNKMESQCGVKMDEFVVGEVSNHNVNNSPNGFGEDALGSSECEYTVPETLCFPSDWETTVTESLCSSPQPKQDSELSFDVKFSNEQQCKTKTGDILLALSPRDSNNNTDISSEFAFIDSESSPSELQPPFEGAAKDRSDLLGTGSSPPRCSPGLPEDILSKMTSELEMFSPKNTHNDFTSHLPDSKNHCSFERFCEELGQKVDLQKPSNCESHNAADVLLNNEITVITQTGASNNNTVTNPEVADDSGVSLTTHNDVHLTEGNSEVSKNKIEDCSLTLNEQINFEDLHARVAPRNSRSPFKSEVRSARIRPRSTTGSPKTVSHNPTSDLTPPPPVPLADTNSCLHPDPIPQNETPSTGCSTAPLPLSPEETRPAHVLLPREESSPHPVKPLTNTTIQGEKKPESRSVLEKLKSTINPGRSAPPTTAEDEKSQLALMEARAQYQNMTNMELIALLLQQEVDMKKQRDETEVQVALLEKRDAELKKMKAQVRDLEDYIDKLLVRIMEQTPTLLQVRARPK